MEKKNNRNKQEKGAAGRVAKRLFAVLGTAILILFLSLLIFACIFAMYVRNDLSRQVDFTLQDFSLDQTSIIYYQDPDTGEWEELQKLYDEENRIWASFEELPQDLLDACVAIEDKRFYEHNGVDLVTTSKASINLFLGRGQAGGSTLTQQLIKNLTGNKEITVRRKIVEIFQALEYEKTHSKDEILERYMNVIYLGQGCSGVRSASMVYFGKDVTELTLAECASLIGITNNPSLYDPYIQPENNRERQMIILQQMLLQEMITQEEYEAAVAQEMVFTSDPHETVDGAVPEEDPQTVDRNGQVYSYFVDQVVRDVTADLAEQSGVSRDVAEKMLYCGGYSIYCTMDPEIQHTLETVYENLDNVPKTTSSQQLQSAMVVIDNESGDVVGIIGGVGEKTGSLTLSRATQTLRSPGSTIKPLSVYTPALELGILTPLSVYDDSPFSVENGVEYPRNQNGEYIGPVTVDYAVGMSLNTVAVRVVDQLTPEYCFRFAKEKMGLSTLVEKAEINGGQFTDVALAPMAMGGLTNGVSVRDMTAAYATLANEGVYRSARTYYKVTDPDDKVILENKQTEHTAAKPAAAWYMTHMLNNATVSGTSTRARLGNIAVAAKTGTTSNDHDRWFAGYTPYYTGVVWCGFDEPEEIRVTSTSTNPALFMWKQVMEVVHKGLEGRQFAAPSATRTVSFCLDSGMLATELCRTDARGSREADGILLAQDILTEPCTLHENVAICEASGGVATPYCSLYPDTTVTICGMIEKPELCTLHTVTPVVPEEPVVPQEPAVPEEPVVPQEPQMPTAPSAPEGMEPTVPETTPPEAGG